MERVLCCLGQVWCCRGCQLISFCVCVNGRNLLANPFNCNCHLAWLSIWLRNRKIVTGNPRCQRPAFLKEIPLQDVALPDFRCQEGTRSSLHKYWFDTLRCYVFTVGWFTALCVCDVGRSRGRELRAAHPVSLGVHLSGDRGPLQQQTPARLTQRNPAQRHRAVSRRSELHYTCLCIVSSIKECIFASKKGGNHSQSELMSC